MNIFKEAEMIETMISAYSLTQSECAKRLGKSQSYVANKLRLLRFSNEIRKRICESGLSERHARLLLALRDERKITECIEKISSMHLTVAASEALVDGLREKGKTPMRPSPSFSEQTCEFEELIFRRVREMRRSGIRIDAKMSEEGRRRYITIAVEKNR